MDEIRYLKQLKFPDEKGLVADDTFFAMKGASAHESHIQISRANVDDVLFISVFDAERCRNTHRRISFELLRDTLLDLHDRIEREDQAAQEAVHLVCHFLREGKFLSIACGIAPDPNMLDRASVDIEDVTCITCKEKINA